VYSEESPAKPRTRETSEGDRIKAKAVFAARSCRRGRPRSFEAMFDKRLIIVAGKGGVGRTTVAAAIGTILARRGRRTLLAHVRSKHRLAYLLDCDQIGTEIRLVEPNLWAVNMEPEAAIRELGMMTLRFRAVYRAVLENRLVKHFIRAVPALEQYSMLGKAWYHTTETLAADGAGGHRYETVIFDGPATGHLISTLRIPKVILDTVPAGPLTRDAKRAQELLADSTRTQLWIVSLAEEMPVSETFDLYRAATEDLKVPVGGIIVNGLYPDEFERSPRLREELGRLVACPDADLAPLIRAAHTSHCRREINRKYLDLLRSRLDKPFVELPQVFAEELGRPHLDFLARLIETQLGQQERGAALS
jgi:anion-transporting  ArsA/GET3 family ATPase